MKTATELKTHILTKAAEDGEFRARLLTDPRAAISAETGVTIPEGFNVAVHEDSGTTAHLVLPPSPARAAGPSAPWSHYPHAPRR